MIQELAYLIDDFPGPVNQTQCFLHILNLVVQSIIQQFDLPKSNKSTDSDDDNDERMNEATKQLLKLAGNIDLEEEMMANAGNEGNATDDDNIDRWVNEHEEMTEEELLDLAESIQPVCLLLTKVH